VLTALGDGAAAFFCSTDSLSSAAACACMGAGPPHEDSDEEDEEDVTSRTFTLAAALPEVDIEILR